MLLVMMVDGEVVGVCIFGLVRYVNYEGWGELYLLYVYLNYYYYGIG